MRGETMELPLAIPAPKREKSKPSLSFAAALKDFREFAQPTRQITTTFRALAEPSTENAQSAQNAVNTSEAPKNSRPRGRARLLSSRNGVITTGAPASSNAVDDLTLSPGERAGVRVSVNPDQSTAQDHTPKPFEIPTFVNEFWTAKQRAASRLHEISYRACFKPQLPRFFIERLTEPGDIVYDPFMGRGTTPLEAAMLGRIPFGSDINPLSVVLTRPRLNPPTVEQVAKRLHQIDFHSAAEFPEDLLVFYHPETLKEIASLKKYLLARHESKSADSVDDWICLLALNRLTGHSPGFFSVYTLPPNQAVSVKSQRKINDDRRQSPPRRHVSALILKKTRILLKDCDAIRRKTLADVAPKSLLLTQLASQTPEMPSDSVALAVTSPPFLDVVDYAGDNWLRCWFLGIDPKSVKLTVPKKLEQWQAAMTDVFRELHRVLKPGGHVAFEVGEVRAGKVKLEEAVLPCGLAAGLEPVLVLINDQKFTKTANCWGVQNNFKGTNTNRIALFRKLM